MKKLQILIIVSLILLSICVFAIMQVKADGTPTASATPTGPVSLDLGQIQVLSADASGGSGTYISYQWYVNGTED